MRNFLTIGAFAAAMLMVSAPGMAQTPAGGTAHGDMQGHEMKGHDMKGHGAAMSEADKAQMAKCNAMSHADAMKDAKCAATMKAHPEGMDHKPKSM